MPSKTSRTRIKRIELGIINSKPEEENNETKLNSSNAKCVLYIQTHTYIPVCTHAYAYIESHLHVHVRIGVYMHVWKICICEGARNQKVI